MQTQGKKLDVMMRLSLPYIVLFLSFICAKNVANAAGAHWCYKDEICGDKTWEGDCRTGKQQSPIDFNAKNTVERTNQIRLRFNRNYMNVQDNFFITNNGHTVQVQLKEDLSSDLLMDGDYLKGSYRFSQLHFHWGSHQDVGSEHTVNGLGYVAELHLVHYSDQYKGLIDAVRSKNPRGLVVLGIFFEISNEENYALRPILNAISQVKATTSELNRIDAPFNMSALLPNDMKLWRYYGSLTTPTCSEVVHWNVFKTPVPLSRTQWDQFKSLRDSESKALEDNNRHTQSTFNRKVFSFEQVVRERKPEAGQLDPLPPAADTDAPQKDTSNKQTPAEDHSKHNSANSGYGGLVNSVITGFLFLSIFLQVFISSVMRCR